MTVNGESDGSGPKMNADRSEFEAALAEHAAWLRGWQRAVACGFAFGDDVRDADAHLRCGVGRWLAARAGRAGVGGQMESAFGHAHRALHDAVREAADGLPAGARIAAGAYDAVMDAAAAMDELGNRIVGSRGGEAEDATTGGPLAELAGRLTMLSELERERDRALRTGSALSLMMIRPDGAGELERDHGQRGLDRLIASFATRLFGMLRPYDGIYRYGRSDFVVCLPGTAASHARRVAERLIQVVSGASTVLPDDSEFPLSAGFGIAEIDRHRPVQETLEHAVRAAVSANAEDSGPIVVWTPACEN